MPGNKNPIVFPEPVSAIAIKSKPWRIIGKTEDYS